MFSRHVCVVFVIGGLPLIQGTRTGKTGKMAKIIPCQGKHREFGNFAKTHGNLVCYFFLSWISLLSQFCVCNSHK